MLINDDDLLIGGDSRLGWISMDFNQQIYANMGL